MNVIPLHMAVYAGGEVLCNHWAQWVINTIISEIQCSLGYLVNSNTANAQYLVTVPDIEILTYFLLTDCEYLRSCHS